MEFCHKYSLTPRTIFDLINMKVSPYLLTGEYKKSVLDMAEIFGCLPDELFTENQRQVIIEKNIRKYEVQESDLQYFLESVGEPKLLEDQYTDYQINKSLFESLETLTEREAKVIKLRFGLDGEFEHTLNEVGEKLGICGQRVRQIEDKALRKLRHPFRSDRIKDLLGD